MKTSLIALAAMLALATPASAAGSFNKILQYTFLNETLPDGKHPVWAYYVSHNTVARVELPSLDMCLVTTNSTADMELMRNGVLQAVPRSQRSFAMQIWQAAFAKYITVGSPRVC